jgi:flagellar basal body-associated protein FliL
VILEHANDSEEEKQKAKTSRLISNIVLVVTLIITIAAMWWIWKKMLEVRPVILRERRIAKKKWVLPEW